MWAKETGRESGASSARPRRPSTVVSRAPGNTGAAGRLLKLQRARGNRYVQNLVGGPRVQRNCACGGTCAACATKEERALLRHAAHEDDGAHMTAVPPVVHEVLNSAGQPLDDGARAFMETRFGRDFGAVRIHTGSRAAESALAVEARAYTVGRSVVFGEGEYQPHTSEGRRLLAHELTHVVQQGGAPSQGELTVSHPQDKEEVEADSMADSVMQMQEPTPHESARLPSGDRPGGGAHRALLASGLQRAREENDSASIGLLERAIDLAETQPDSLPYEYTHPVGPSSGGECTTCTAQRAHRQAAPLRGAKLSRATLARDPSPRSRIQCINANLANAGIPWAILAIAGGVCGILGAVATSPTGPGAAAGGAGAAAVCISAVTGASVGMVLGVITRCIQNPSVEWVFAQAETGGAGEGGGTETANA